MTPRSSTRRPFVRLHFSSLPILRGLTVLFLFVTASCSVPLVRDLPLLNPKHPFFRIPHEYSVTDPQFERSVGSLLGPGILDGNRITTLLNGEQIFPAMLASIKAAKRTINFETFIYWDGEVGKQFTDALAERARAGVEVNVIVDWFGMSNFRAEYLPELEQAGAHVVLFHQLHWFDPRGLRDLAHLDNRTHRKILVVDGSVGYTGGVGIADLWSGDGRSEDHWRDTHYRVEGPVVAELQSAFVDNWIESGGRLLHGDPYFPELHPVGEVRAQVFKGSPGDATDNIELMYRLAIISSRKSIFISNAYFVPDPGIIRTLVSAAERGVKIEILVPGPHMDQLIVRSASRALWGELLDAGVKIYEYSPTMLHCKVMVVDGFFTSVGSTNFDNRSFHLNDEVNLNVFNERVASEQETQFAADKQLAKEISKDSWRNRTLFQRALDHLSVLFREDL